MVFMYENECEFCGKFIYVTKGIVLRGKAVESVKSYMGWHVYVFPMIDMGGNVH